MISVLTLSFDSFLQSFGSHSELTHRDTDSLPTKSQVIGMILNALGHDKNADDAESKRMPKEWSDKLRFGVIQSGIKEPQKMTDFCIARRNDNKGNDLIHKDYIVDSKYSVFLEGEDKDIELIAKALLIPQRQLSFGRRCCPLSKPLCWNKDHPSITRNVRLEEIMFKDLNLFRYYLPDHLIECGDAASYNKRTLSDEIKQIINTCIGENKWTPDFFMKEKTSPVIFGNSFWSTLLCYKIIYLRYGDLEEIETQ